MINLPTHDVCVPDPCKNDRNQDGTCTTVSGCPALVTDLNGSGQEAAKERLKKNTDCDKNQQLICCKK